MFLFCCFVQGALCCKTAFFNKQIVSQAVLLIEAWKENSAIFSLSLFQANIKKELASLLALSSYLKITTTYYKLG